MYLFLGGTKLRLLRSYLIQYYASCRKMNLRRNKDTSLWEITRLIKDHNHDPIHDVVLAYQQRVKELTDEQKEFILSLVGGGVPPEDVLTC